jgi:hypothetical protein
MSSAGSVTLTAAAPAGGALVTLADNSPAATVPGSVTVPEGATTATFSVATTSVATSTSATLTGAYNGVSRATTLTITATTAPPPPPAGVTLTVRATGRSGESVVSSPAGINAKVGTIASASFAVNTVVTLRASNNRDAIWSGSCSSGGNKAKSCTFTIKANSTVTGNVQ